MTPDSTPFKNRYIPVDQWPLACQQQWQAACTEADIFQKRKPATQWRKATIRKNVCGLGSLISWIIHTQNFRSNADVSEIVIRDHIAGFVKELREADYASNTIFNHVQGIHDCAKVMDPTQDWSWLLNAVKKLRSKAKPTRNKLKRLQPAQKLDLLGCKLMDEAETNAKLTFYKRALMFRDGLMISLLIHRPLRLGNFASVDIGGRLTLYAKSAVFSFPAEEMKSKRPFEAHFPKKYVSALTVYLEVYRPYLLSLRHEDAPADVSGLWVSNEGRQLADQSLRNAIKKRTAKEFGLDLTPHLFRDSSVTTLVRDAPESARLTRPILGHSTIEVTNKHYNQAQMVDASRRHLNLMEQLINATPT
jgi:integrase/recombinase XerD